MPRSLASEAAASSMARTSLSSVATTGMSCCGYMTVEPLPMRAMTSGMRGGEKLSPKGSGADFHLRIEARRTAADRPALAADDHGPAFDLDIDVLVGDAGDFQDHEHLRVRLVHVHGGFDNADAEARRPGRADDVPPGLLHALSHALEVREWIRCSPAHGATSALRLPPPPP